MLYFHKDRANNIEFVAESLELIFENILNNIFGEQFYMIVNERILEGLRLLSSEYTDKDLEDNEGFSVRFESN